MRAFKLFLLPVLDFLEFGWQVIRYALIFVSAFFRQRASLACETFNRNRNTVIQFQPVIPVQLGENWNLITRTIGAISFQPDITMAHGGTFGFGDLNPSFFLSPVNPGKLIWGAGPTFVIPTATDNVLGTGKFSIGPAIVAAVRPGK